MVKYCKNNSKTVSTQMYSASTFLKSLGPKSEIIGTSFSDLGFSFEFLD